MIPDLDPPISADQQEILEGLPGQGAVTLTRLWGNYLATGEARPAKLTENLSSAGLSLGDWYAFADAGKVIETEYIKPGTWDGRERDLSVLKAQKRDPSEDEADATAADLKAANASTRWAWQGWIQQGATTCLAAEPGTGKTRFCMDLARRIYNCLPWPDGQVPSFAAGTPTLWIPADNQHGELIGIPEEMGIPLDAIVINTRKADPFGGTNLDSPNQLLDLERRIERIKPALVLVDTVGMVTEKATYKPEEAKQVFKPFSDIARRTETAIVLVTHLSANGSPLGRRIVGATRQVIKLVKPEGCEENRRKLWVDKTSHLVPPPLGVSMGTAGNEYDGSPPEAEIERKAFPASLKAEVWLKRFLAQHGEASDKAIKEAAKVDGVGKNALWEAKGAMKGAGAIRSARRGGELWWIGTAPEGKTFEDVFGE